MREPAAQTSTITIAGVPVPESQIRLEPSTPMTVPTGALLVVTCVGSLDEFQSNPTISFNGQPVLDVRLFDSAERRAIVEVPPGLVASGGTTVSCTGVLLGYLARASEAPTFAVRGVPRPTEMTRVVKGIPLVVPNGKRFVATGFGTTQGERTADIQIDGHLMVRARLDNTTGYVVPIPAGLTAAEGKTVEVLDNNTTGAAVLLGYLADV
jgi:hypothetical protein